MKMLTQFMLFCGLAILIPVSLHAEEQKEQTQTPPRIPDGQVLKLPTLINCGPKNTVMKPVIEAHERPFLSSTAVIQLPEHGLIAAKSTIYMNPQTATYSVIIFLEQNETLAQMNIDTCLIGMGSQIRPALPTGRAL